MSSIIVIKFKRKRFVLGLLMAVIISSNSASAAGLLLSDAPNIKQSNLSEQTTESVNHDLGWYLGTMRPIVLKGRSAEGSVGFSIPAQRLVAAVKLHLIAMNSASLITGGSQLLITINNQPIKQIKLDGDTPNIDKVVALPLNDIHNGSNNISFSVTQKSTTGCEGFNSPELWTKIYATSDLTITYLAPKKAPSWATLRQIFAETEPSTSRLLVLYDKSFERTPEAIMAIARSITKLKGHDALKVVAFPLTQNNMGMANSSAGPVVILRNVVQQKVAGNVNTAKMLKSVLSISRNPVGGVIITIQGNNPDAVAKAARMLGQNNVVWPDSSKVVFTEGSTSKELSDNSSATQDSSTVSFKQSGMATQTAHGTLGHLSQISFWNPNWGSHALLYLHLAYSGGSAPGSMIQAIVNGKMVNTIPLTNVDGGTYPDYKLLIPQNALKVGRNILDLKPVFNVRHSSGGVCTTNDFDRSLAVTIFSDSRLSIIGGSPVRKDDLSAISAGEYHLHSIVIVQPTPEIISAAATLGAKLAQVSPNNTLYLLVEQKPKPLPGLLVLGDIGHLPLTLLHQSGILEDHGVPTVTEPADEAISLPGGDTLSTVTSWLNKALNENADSASSALPPQRPNGPVASIGSFANSAIMSIADAKTSPSAPGTLAPAIVLTAQTGSELIHAVSWLTNHQIWKQLAGQAAVITPGSETLQLMPAMNEPVGTSAQLGYLATQNPVAAVLGILAILVMLIILVRVFIALRRRRTHPAIRGVDE